MAISNIPGGMDHIGFMSLYVEDVHNRHRDTIRATPKPTHCVGCGAPVRGHKCAYCGLWTGMPEPEPVPEPKWLCERCGSNRIDESRLEGDGRVIAAVGHCWDCGHEWRK